jgi:hypothetical protein
LTPDRLVASGDASLPAKARHAAYSAGWKKFEGLWNVLIRGGQVTRALPVLEAVLSGLDSSDHRVAGRPAPPPIREVPLSVP